MKIDERYEMELGVRVNRYSAEYAECGSHEIRLILQMDIDRVIELYEKLKKLIEEEDQDEGR